MATDQRVDTVQDTGKAEGEVAVELRPGIAGGDGAGADHLVQRREAVGIDDPFEDPRVVFGRGLVRGFGAGGDPQELSLQQDRLAHISQDQEVDANPVVLPQAGSESGPQTGFEPPQVVRPQRRARDGDLQDPRPSPVQVRSPAAHSQTRSDPAAGGYKIDVRGTAVRVLEQMELAAEARRHRTGVTDATFVDSSGRRLARLDGELFGGRSDNDIEILREDLLWLLLEALREGSVHRFGDGSPRSARTGSR